MRNKLLLHVCCGPCSTVVMKKLSEEHEVTGFFYNPNIQPEQEYFLRLDASFKAAYDSGIPLISGRYEPDKYDLAVTGLENEPENGLRCLVCYRMRLRETARRAVEGSFTHIASTLTLGPSKKAAIIDSIGVEEASGCGLTFVSGDWKKEDGFKLSCEMSKSLGLYRQNYCGCLFSKRG